MRFVRDLPVSVRNLRWAGFWPAGALIAVRLAERTVGPVTAIALASLVGAIASHESASMVGAALPPLVFLALVMLAGHLGDAAAEPLEYLVKSRVDGAHRQRLGALVTARSDLAGVEAPEAQVLIRQVNADPEHTVESTPGDGVLAAVRWLTGLCGGSLVCAILVSFAWWLLPIVLVPALVTVAVRGRLAFAQTGAWEEATWGELHTNVWREANVSVGEAKDIRVFGLRDWMVDRMQRQLREVNRPLWREMERLLRLEWLMFLLMLLALVPAYLLVTHGALTGAATVTTQTAVLAAGLSLFQVLGNGTDVRHIAGAGRVDRAYSRLTARLSVSDHPFTADLEGPVRAVRFEGVGFSYPGTERPVLDGVDLEIRPDQLLAIVGLNGAGKSTLIKLLSGLYRPTAGRIVAETAHGSVDIGDLDPRLWRSRLAVIFQDFNRYPLSARDNVTMGRADREPDEAILAEVARDSGLAGVLDRLPRGWDTPLSRGRTGGVDLSGGQWQQLVLARALYGVRSGADLLVADEPTAHLDVRTEFALFHRLAEQRRETGIVLISHRLSTVRRADRIVLLDGGRITEVGTHEELVALGGTYAEMFAIQAARFRDTEGEERS